MPKRPMAASSPNSSRGKACASSSAAARGAMRSSLKRANVSRTCLCSGLGSKFMPLVVDDFQQHAVHRLRVHEAELAVAKLARAADERIALRLEFVHRGARVVDVERDDHYALATLLDELRDLAVRRERLHQLETDAAQPVPRHLDLLRLVDVGVVGLVLAEDRLPDLARRLEVADRDADVIDLVRLHAALMIAARTTSRCTLPSGLRGSRSRKRTSRGCL